MQSKSGAPGSPLVKMATVDKTKKEHLIVDTGAFIRLKQLERFEYETVHIVPGVADEIRDKVARQQLQISATLPLVSIPTERDVAFVRRFAKETGDLGFLSSTDIDVIALTYMLQRLTGDVENLKSKPTWKKENVLPEDISSLGQYKWGTKRESTFVGVEDTDNSDKNQIESDNLVISTEDVGTEETNLTDDESDGEWIGETNLNVFLVAEQGTITDSVEIQPRVACLTTDYSMQNVMLQMGLSVLSVDGLRIQQTKNWTLFCRGCRSVTMDTTRRFCPNCGNMSVQRVPVTINADGYAVVQPMTRRLNPRGKIFSIPKPKGGRQGDLILSEDQLLIGGKDRLSRHQQKQWEKEKQARNPFNPDVPYEQNGWWNRQLTRSYKGPQIGLGPGNPNSNRWQKHKSRRK